MTKTMEPNGTTRHSAGVSQSHRHADEMADDCGECGEEEGDMQQDAAANHKPKHMLEGKTGKILLGVGAAVVAIVATEYALRKFTKTGGILPHLRRLEKLSKAYMATVEKP